MAKGWKTENGKTVVHPDLVKHIKETTREQWNAKQDGEWAELSSDEIVARFSLGHSSRLVIYNATSRQVFIFAFESGCRVSAAYDYADATVYTIDSVRYEGDCPFSVYCIIDNKKEEVDIFVDEGTDVVLEKFGIRLGQDDPEKLVGRKFTTTDIYRSRVSSTMLTGPVTPLPPEPKPHTAENGEGKES